MKNDGGPAFPNWEIGPDGPEGADGTLPVPGMSLRDWFAGQAMVGLMSDPNMQTFFASKAYEIADAMLKAREGE